MVTRRLIKGSGGQDFGWYLTTSAGGTTDSVRGIKGFMGMDVDDTHICVAMEADKGDFGVTQDHILIQDFDLDGNLNWEKVLGDDTDTYDVNRDQDITKSMFGNALDWVKCNPNDSGYVLVAGRHDETPEQFLVNINTTPAIAHAVWPDTDSDLGNCLIVPISNGDVWYTHLSTGNAILLDRSHTTPYANDIAKWASTTSMSNKQAICVDSSDNLYMAGVYSGQYARFIRINTSGTVTLSRDFAVATDASDDTTAYGICVDGSGNIYVSFHFYDASVATNYTCISKFNSSGTEQWTRRIDGYYYGTNNICIVMSPDDNFVYHAPGPTGDQLDIYVHDVSDGSVENSWSWNLNGGAGGTDDFRAGFIRCNSTDVFVAWYYSEYFGSPDFTRAYNGAAVMKLSQTAFEAGNSYQDLTAGSVSASGTTDIAMGSTVAGGTGAGSPSSTPSDISSKFALSSLDAAMTLTKTDLP
jgi:hypothetical protein